MRRLFCVLLIAAGCKPNPPPELNTALAGKLEAFGRDDSQVNLEACLNALRTSSLFIGVKDGHAAIKTDPARGQVLFAFLEAPAAVTWWAPVDGITAQATPVSDILDIAMFEQADLLMIEPQRTDRTMVIPRENFAPIAKAWGSLRPSAPGAVDGGPAR